MVNTFTYIHLILASLRGKSFPDVEARAREVTLFPRCHTVTRRSPDLTESISSTLPPL